MYIYISIIFPCIPGKKPFPIRAAPHTHTAAPRGLLVVQPDPGNSIIAPKFLTIRSQHGWIPFLLCHGGYFPSERLTCCFHYRGKPRNMRTGLFPLDPQLSHC